MTRCAEPGTISFRVPGPRVRQTDVLFTGHDLAAVLPARSSSLAAALPVHSRNLAAVLPARSSSLAAVLPVHSPS